MSTKPLNSCAGNSKIFTEKQWRQKMSLKIQCQNKSQQAGTEEIFWKKYKLHRLFSVLMIL